MTLTRWSRQAFAWTACSTALAVLAEPNTAAGPAVGLATAGRLEFRVVIPATIFVRVGSDSPAPVRSGPGGLSWVARVVSNGNASNVSFAASSTAGGHHGQLVYTAALP